MNVEIRHADPPVTRSRLSRVWKIVRRDRYLYAFMVPVLAYFLMFKYGPMYWTLIAFKNYRLADGLAGSPWVGLANFHKLFTSPDFIKILRNTLLLNLYSLVFGFPIPVILAVMLNEVHNVAFKKATQSFLYLPHFISWVIMGGILTQMLSPSSGVINMFLHNVSGMTPYYFMAHNTSWVVVFVLSGIWKEAGWGTIIYLAAITGVDLELYEAAKIDGAGKLKQIWHVTLPGIRGTVAIMLILKMGSMMDVGFEQIYALMNNAVLDVSDVISTYVYRIGIQNIQYSYTTALGLFQSVIALILILTANKIVKMLGESGLW